MEIEKSFYIGTHPHSFQCGIPALIVGVKHVVPEGYDQRPCFVIEYSDGVWDYVPISDVGAGKLVPQSQLPESYIILEGRDKMNLFRREPLRTLMAFAIGIGIGYSLPVVITYLLKH